MGALDTHSNVSRFFIIPNQKEKLARNFSSAISSLNRLGERNWLFTHSAELAGSQVFKEMMNFTQTEVSLLRNERAPFRPALPIRAGFEEEPRSQRREPYGTAMTRVTETSSEIKLTEKDIANALEHIRILIKAKMTKVKDRRALLKLQSSLAAVGQFLTLSVFNKSDQFVVR